MHGLNFESKNMDDRQYHVEMLPLLIVGIHEAETPENTNEYIAYL